VTSLVAALEKALPRGVTLARVPLATVPEVELHLLDPSCLDAPLSGAGAHAAHVTPPYWALAWASGQVLARYVLDHPEIVAGKRVVDFGCGSGLVAIAAKRAGAREALALDRDAHACLAAELNAHANDVRLAFGTTLPDTRFDVLLAADVLYDRDNAPLLDVFRAHAEHVIVAESRFARLPHAAFTERFAKSACTFPDIDESATLKYVRVFFAAGADDGVERETARGPGRSTTSV
jgi:predicted nicotinamide N-methyase